MAVGAAEQASFVVWYRAKWWWEAKQMFVLAGEGKHHTWCQPNHHFMPGNSCPNTFQPESGKQSQRWPEQLNTDFFCLFSCSFSPYTYTYKYIYTWMSLTWGTALWTLFRAMLVRLFQELQYLQILKLKVNQTLMNVKHAQVSLFACTVVCNWCSPCIHL